MSDLKSLGRRFYDEVFGKGDMAALDDQGEFMGIPATGRTVDVGFADRIRFRDARAVEHWGVTDMMAMMQQLGVIDPES